MEQTENRIDLSGFIEKAEPLFVHEVKVTQNGVDIASHSWVEEGRRNIYSAVKSVTSCAVGIAIREGLLSLDEKLADAFAGELPEQPDGRLMRATVRDLLTMCLGQEKRFLMGPERLHYEEEDWVKLALAQPFAHEPGTHFLYSNVGPYLAGILVQRRAGCDLVSYLKPRLFDPLGIWRPTWETDPLGRTFGSSGLLLSLDELHRFGLLYLNEGCWNGKQLVPRDWVLESTKKQVENGRFGYGYLFWGTQHGGFMANGKYGQITIILREQNTVITTLAECRVSGALEKLIFEEIWPQLA